MLAPIPNNSPLGDLSISSAVTLKPAPKGNAKHTKAVAYMKEMQELIISDFREATGKPLIRSQLALAFTRLQECIRVSRGIPSPGQLRPDLDPVQMARMLKRARKRQPIDIPSDIRAALKSAKGKSWAEEAEPKDSAT